MSDVSKNAPCIGANKEQAERPKNAAEKAFFNLFSSLEGSKGDYVTLSSREENVEFLWMLPSAPGVVRGGEDYYIRYDKTTRVGPKQIVSGSNKKRIELQDELSKLENELKDAKSKKNDSLVESIEYRIKRRKEDMDSEKFTIETDLGKNYLQAFIGYDPKTTKFYYTSNLSKGDPNIDNTKWEYKEIKNFPGSQQGRVLIAPEKALQILNRMKAEFDAATKGKKIQANTSLLLSEFKDTVEIETIV